MNDPVRPLATAGGLRLDSFDRALVQKYDTPGPRYTSYPTAPHFSASFGPADHAAALFAAARSEPPAPLSLYFHLPFCESACYFCGCNVIFTKDRSRADAYIDLLEAEMDRVVAALGPGRRVEQLHLGGGTPTFLSPALLARMWRAIADRFTIAAEAELGVEIDPRETTAEHLQVLGAAGFRRLSLGVQDFDERVQRAVHRIQPLALTADTIATARRLGFQSVNVDLIYGLPHQTLASFEDTVDKLVGLGPDRIACFSFAYLPSLFRQQRAIRPEALPSPETKLDILAMTVARLGAAGYAFVGMDHFARPTDELFRAIEDRTLTRNFQGYSTHGGCDLVAFGVSAISQIGDVYAQNHKGLPEYEQALAAGQLPTARGCRLTAADRLRRDVITRLMCHPVLLKGEIEARHGIDFDATFADELGRLDGFERDGLLRRERDRITILPAGRFFLRNIAMTFDAYLRHGATGQTFSRTV